MDVDSVLERIGELGLAQLTIVTILAASQLYTGMNQIVLPLVSLNPGWSCVVYTEPSSGGFSAVNNSRCVHYENNMCTPKFAGNYSSIVTEVSDCFINTLLFLACVSGCMVSRFV